MALLPSLECSTLPLIRTHLLLSVKQGGIKSHWTQVSQTIGDHSNRKVNEQVELDELTKYL